MPDLDVLNDPDLLRDTPIGDLEVRNMWGSFVGICLRSPDPDKPGRCIHRLEPGQSVLNAIYGKRTFEQESVRRLYAQQKTEADESLARSDAQRSEDHSREHARLIRRYGKAEYLEAMARMGLVGGR